MTIKRPSTDSTPRYQPQQKLWRHPDLPWLECRYAANSSACYRRHSHPTFSLGVVEAGISRYYHRGGTQTIGPGAIVAVMPDQIHACNPPEDQPWSYHMLYLDSDWIADLQRQFAPGRSVPDRLSRLPELLYRPSLYRRIVECNRLAFSAAAQLEKQTALIELVAGLIGETDGQNPNAASIAGNDPAVTRVCEYLRAYGDNNLSLDQLARVAQLSPWQLIRRFRRSTGFTPHAWQLDQRINRARQLLRRSMPIAEVALETGFSDQAHFQRSFKGHTAMTPARYRRG